MRDTTRCDEDLARRVAGGDVDCFDELVSRYESRLLVFLRRKTRSAHDAEDLAQQAFIAAYRKIGRFDPARRFAPWLFTIAARLAIDHARVRARFEALRGEPGGEPGVRGEERQAEHAESLWALARERLPDSQFTALWLKYGEDLSVREIAGVMAKSSVHVKVLLHRGRKALLAAAVGRREGE